MDTNRGESIPAPAVRRLSLYLRQMETFHQLGRPTISSQQLGESLGLTDAQVRKDLAYCGQFGHPGIGYKVEELIIHIRRILGTDRMWNVLLVGAGNLGRALMSYTGFERKGFRVVAIFDADPAKIGTQQGPFVVQSPVELGETMKSRDIRLAIIAVPGPQAQAVADQLVRCGVKGILNFAPVQLNLPPHVATYAVDLAVTLEQISFYANAMPAAQAAAVSAAPTRTTPL